MVGGWYDGDAACGRDGDSAYSSMAALDDSTLPLMHGTLILRIEEARDLPDTDSGWWQSSKNVTDPYVKVQLYPVGVKIAESKVINDSLFPVWGEEFRILVCHNVLSIRVTVLDKDTWDGDAIGECDVDCTQILGLIDGEQIDEWFPLRVGKGDDTQGAIRIGLEYFPKGSLETDTDRIVPCYFPPRGGCRVTLYQDADTPYLPVFQGVSNPDGSPYTPTRLWRDIFHSIMAAEKFVYVVGWSVDTSKSLLRGVDDPDCTNSKIGDVLRCKAEAGVRVLVLIWNDLSSADWVGAGQMGTHDEETEHYFTGTGVTVANVGRGLDHVVYTHHQKTVIMDSGDRIISYLGGIDLTDGRFDTPEYKLFDYSSEHSEDFYQNCTPGATIETGPREPWHDIHARLEGPAALDVLANFEERWRRQAEDKEGFLYEITEDEFIAGNPLPEDEEDDAWVAQIFRSITSESALFDETRSETLTGQRGNEVDDSIHRAYIQQIRRADRFIYIENQYFLGSAYSWTKERNTKARHTVPREIVTKIIEKMDQGEEFVCYVVIPMYPEGDPTSMASQEILYWQYCTMESMYWRIGNAIAQRGLHRHPTDYLMFFCPGKQECPDDVPDSLLEPDSDTPASLVRSSLRHPIYVHSKMMIVDDDYIIVGTANINQRSLGGNRDTEIAVGGFQPGHTGEEEDGEPRGQIHTFRMSLFAAHLGGHHDAYLNPSSPSCVEKVRQVTSEFQQLYGSDQVPEETCPVHLMEYPIQVDSEGNVSAVWDVFPDTEASVLGAKSGCLPGNLTT